MPLALTPIPSIDQFESAQIVLIVPCHGCPRMCIAAERGKPFMNIGRRETDAFHAYIDEIRQAIAAQRKTATVMKTPATSPMMCIWPHRVRDRLATISTSYDAIGVIGCESAVAKVAGAVSISRDAIVPLSRTVGIANFLSKIDLPFSITLAPSPQGTVPLPHTGANAQKGSR